MGRADSAADILLDATRDFGLWPNTLRCLASQFHSDHGFAYLVTPKMTQAFVSQGSEEILTAVVKERWHERNPRMRRGLEYARSGSNRLLTDWRLFSKDEIAGDSFEQEFANRYDTIHYAGAFIQFSENSFLVLSFERSRKKGEFWGSELDIVEAGIEQGRRSIMYALKTQSQLLTGLVNDLGSGEVAQAWLSCSGSLKHTSPAFMPLIDKFISVRNGKLHAMDDSDSKLQHLISRSANGDQVNEVVVLQDAAASGEIACVRAIPMRTLNLGLQGFADVLLSIEVKRPRATTLLSVLRERFGLTQAEAQLVIRLDQGLSLREAAEAQHVSYETARTRLKIVFTKLDVARQTELLRKLNRLPA